MNDLVTNEKLQGWLNYLQDSKKRDAFMAIYDARQLRGNPNYRKELSQDRRDMLRCIKDGWYEIFDRFDSDLVEQFIATYQVFAGKGGDQS